MIMTYESEHFESSVKHIPEIKNKQHYVFRAYLKKWYLDNDIVWVYDKETKKVFHNTAENILHKHQIYKIQKLNDDEKNFIELLMTSLHLTNADKSEMRDHINAYLLPFSNQTMVDALKRLNPIPKNHPMNEDMEKMFSDLDEMIKVQQINSEEDFYSEYEAEATVWFNRIVDGDVEFYYSNEPDMTETGNQLSAHHERDEFLNFVCIQYFRTMGMRKVLTDNIQNMILYTKQYLNNTTDKKPMNFNPNNVNPEHILPHMIWIMQAKCSARLSGRNADLQIVRNRTDLPFITSDQPVINIMAEVGGKAPDEFVLFYPMNPKTAIIINGGKGEKELEKKSEVNELNKLIWDHAHKFVVADRKEILNGMIDMYGI